jgi:hypothetical protein
MTLTLVIATFKLTFTRTSTRTHGPLNKTKRRK